jgi:hypothetical protein
VTIVRFIARLGLSSPSTSLRLIVGDAPAEILALPDLRLVGALVGLVRLGDALVAE